MENTVEFPAPDGRGALEARVREVRAKLAKLDEKEPADMASEAYDKWADRHEALEDELDELLDFLDET